MSFRLVQKSVKLNDLERHNGHYAVQGNSRSAVQHTNFEVASHCKNMIGAPMLNKWSK